MNVVRKINKERQYTQGIAVFCLYTQDETPKVVTIAVRIVMTMLRILLQIDLFSIGFLSYKFLVISYEFFGCEL